MEATTETCTHTGETILHKGSGYLGDTYQGPLCADCGTEMAHTYTIQIAGAAPIRGFVTETDAEKFAQYELPEGTPFMVVTELPMVLA